jgi:hypothetical protein
MNAPITCNWRANSEASILFFKETLRTFPDSKLPSLMAVICGLGLMRPRGWFRMAVKVISWRHREPKHAAYLRMFIMGERGLNLAKEIRAQTVQHILQGRDTEDADSVGGFSQREINIIGWTMNQLTGEAA